MMREDEVHCREDAAPRTIDGAWVCVGFLLILIIMGCGVWKVVQLVIDVLK